uniref:plasmid fertility inhibition factor family protein n=2 Tax=Burkholderia TaxID=32008 RepID=UPI00158D589E|nr:Osa protein [Burkholderia anthina]
MLTRLRIGLDRARDLRDASRPAPIQPRPQACELVDLSAKRATWRVPVPGQADCYLAATPGETERYVVHIDADRFYALWLGTSPAFPRLDSQDCVPRRIMPLDRKFSTAAAAFRGGRLEPVTLPPVGYWLEGSGYEVAMSDGMTRTYWLLANRVRSFPVSVNEATWAMMLNNMAGVGVSPIAFSALFSRRA